MSTPNQEYILTSDDDGHWYVIPADKLREFGEAVSAFDDTGDIPDWADPVGGSPCRVKFKGYRIT